MMIEAQMNKPDMQENIPDVITTQVLEMIREETKACWQWCGYVWKNDHLRHAALTLQEQFSVDCQLLLLSQWYGMHKRLVSQAFHEELLFSTLDWSLKVVLPLRSMRRYIDSNAFEHPEQNQNTFLHHIQNIELESERLQQYQLMYKFYEFCLKEIHEIREMQDHTQCMQLNFNNLANAYRIAWDPDNPNDHIVKISNLLLKSIFESERMLQES
ncbi:MAG: TIGR02444 family protein [Pseudomonadota bacterium]